MRRLFTITLIGVMLAAVSASVMAGKGKGPGTGDGSCLIDGCGEFCDGNGDGICDICDGDGPQRDGSGDGVKGPKGPRDGSCGRGRGPGDGTGPIDGCGEFVDEDGDGVCDICGAECDGSGPDGDGPKGEGDCEGDGDGPKGPRRGRGRK